MDTRVWSIVGRSMTALAVMILLAAFATFAPTGARAQDQDVVTVTLDELNDSGVAGEATLTADGESTTVDISVSGATGDHPVHIHEGTCDDLEPAPLYTLTDIDAEGVSQTTVDVALSELTGAEFAINAHLSADQIGTYVACGNIVALAAPAPADDDDDAAAAAGTGGVTTPATGVGSAFVRESSNGLLIGLGALAVMLAMGGLVLRRRESRI